MIRAILTDIEGTTSSISFVHDVLFPYAREHLGDFVRARRTEPAVAAELAEVARLAGLPEDDLEGQIAQLEAWMREDRKITPLKTLQGMVWKRGYEQGDFKGHLYADAAEQLRRWHERGIRLYVYSSGSVQAQKLLFGYSEFGDLTPLFQGYFDTNMGGKRESDSYRRILAEIGLPAEQVLFLSDVEEELEAARNAGLGVCRLVRNGALPEQASYPVVADFSSIELG